MQSPTWSDGPVVQKTDAFSRNWWEVPEFLATPFDLVIDLWGTRPAWDHAVASPAVAWEKARRDGARRTWAVGAPHVFFWHQTPSRWWG